MRSVNGQSDTILQTRATRPGLFEAFRWAWSARFQDPILLPGGGEIATLREAGDYVIALPDHERCDA